MDIQKIQQYATQLQDEYGKKGFEPLNIRRMMQFAKEFPDSQIVEDWVKIGKSSRPRRDDGIYGSESRTPGS